MKQFWETICAERLLVLDALRTENLKWNERCWKKKVQRCWIWTGSHSRWQARETGAVSSHRKGRLTRKMANVITPSSECHPPQQMPPWIWGKEGHLLIFQRPFLSDCPPCPPLCCHPVFLSLFPSLSLYLPLTILCLPHSLSVFTSLFSFSVSEWVRMSLLWT